MGGKKGYSNTGGKNGARVAAMLIWAFILLFIALLFVVGCTTAPEFVWTEEDIINCCNDELELYPTVSKF